MSYPDHVQEAMDKIFKGWRPDSMKPKSKEAAKTPAKVAKKGAKAKATKKKAPAKATKKETVLRETFYLADPILKEAFAREKGKKLTNKMANDILQNITDKAKNGDIAVMMSGEIRLLRPTTVLSALPVLRENGINTPVQLQKELLKNGFIDFGTGVLKSPSLLEVNDVERVYKVFLDMNNTNLQIQHLKDPEKKVKAIEPEKEEFDLDTHDITQTMTKEDKLKAIKQAASRKGVANAKIVEIKADGSVIPQTLKSVAAVLNLKGGGEKATRERVKEEVADGHVSGGRMFVMGALFKQMKGEVANKISNYLSPTKGGASQASELRAAASEAFEKEATKSPLAAAEEEEESDEEYEFKRDDSEDEPLKEREVINPVIVPYPVIEGPIEDGRLW
jgi:uncharacterized protein with GYD domain